VKRKCFRKCRKTFVAELELDSAILGVKVVDGEKLICSPMSSLRY
jgi:hypothetical protein